MCSLCPSFILLRARDPSIRNMSMSTHGDTTSLETDIPGELRHPRRGRIFFFLKHRLLRAAGSQLHSLLIMWLVICPFVAAGSACHLPLHGSRLVIAQFADSMAPHLLLCGGRLMIAQFADSMSRLTMLFHGCRLTIAQFADSVAHHLPLCGGRLSLSSAPSRQQARDYTVC